MDCKGYSTSDIVVGILINWGAKIVFEIPSDGINSVIESLRLRKENIYKVKKE